MDLHDLTRQLGDISSLDRLASPLSQAAKKLIPRGAVKDLLSGTPLGHPLHPVLTDLPIGFFTSAAVLDVVGGRRAQPAVKALLTVGIVAALPTASAGLADWSDTYGPDQRVGVVHAVVNASATLLFAGSLVARRGGRRARGRLLSLAGMATLATGGYLGGYLSFARGVGVNNAFLQEPPADWTGVADEAELQPGCAIMRPAGGATVLLYASGRGLHAIGSRCTHAGGPLQEGKIDDGALCVECPWHGSVFSLEDGSVVHGPASIPEAAYDVRIRDGRVEVRPRA
jgi:nitrite reductase/ring-hydroxylating ferredoxin subunit/uncharacterized membrane protein